MHPILRRTLKWLGITLGGVLVLLIALIGALQIPALQRALGDYVSAAISAPDMIIKLDGLAGGLPFGPRLAKVELGDAQGTWATVDDAVVSIDPWALLGGRIHVERIEARRIALDRLPAPSTAAEPEPPADGAGFSIPQLPKGLALDRLAVPEIILGPALAGEATRFALNGRIGVEADGTAGVVLGLAPIDGAVSTTLDIDARHRPADDHLTLSLRLDDPAGGPISRLAGLPADRPIHVRLAGEGPLSGFAAELEAAAAGAGLNGRLTLGRGGDGAITLALTAKADPGPFLPPDLAPLAVDGISLDLAGGMAGEIVEVRHLDIGAKGLSLALKGQLAGGSDATFDAVVTVDPALDLAALAQVPPAFRPGRVMLVGTADLAEGSATFGRIEVVAPGVTLEGTAALADGFTTATAAIDGSVPDLSLLPQAGLAGAGQLAVKVDGPITPLDLAFDVTVTGENIAGDAQLPHLLGPAPRVAMAGRYSDAGPVVLDRLSVVTAAATVDGKAKFDLVSGAVEAVLSAKADDLARLGVAGLSGSIVLDGTIGGTATVPVIDVKLNGTGVSAGGTAFGDPQLVLLATPNPSGTSTGRLDLTTGGAYPTTLGTDLAFDGRHVTLSNLLAEVLGAKVAGDLAYGLEDGLATGAIKLTAADLRSLSAVAGQPLAGRLAVDLVIAPRGGGQGADVTVEGGGIAAAGVTVAHLGAKATLDDLLGAGKGKATVDVGNVVSGTTVVDTLSLKADLASFEDVSFDIATGGKLPAEIRLGLKGRYQGGDAATVTLASLDGAVGTTPLRLEKPLEISLGAATRIKGLAFAFGQARITGDVALGAAASGAIKVVGFNFADLEPLAGEADLPAGTADLDLTIKGNTGALVVAARKIKPPPSVGLDIAEADVPEVDIDARVDWSGNTARLDVKTSGTMGATLVATGSVPVRIDGGIPLPAEKGDMNVVVKVDADLRRLAPILPIGENQIRGKLALDLTVTGPLDAPRPSGRLTLDKGLVVHSLSGLELRNLTLAVAFTNDRMTIDALSGDDGSGGKLSGSGAGSRLADGDFALNGAIKAQGFHFTRLDLATTRGDLDVALGGTLTAPEIKGDVIIRGGEIEIASKIPPSVPVVEVRDPAKAAVDEPKVLSPTAQEGEAAPPKIGQIDLTVTAPGQFFVRGRGLDSEWRGTLKVQGPITKPDVRGGFEVVRGTYALAGRSFKISEGSLTFPSGLAAPPQLKVISSAPADDVEATITISGPVTALKIELSSDPALPNDEVLSRVLFGRSVSNLSASQAVRLGQTALELSGKGGGGVLGGARDALGLDRLDVGSSDTESSGSGGGNALSGSTLSAGRYVAEGVYLGFSQGLTPDSGSVNIEVEVYPRVTVEGNIGQANNTGVGLNYKFDY
jgi:translocation and assembly module TamB